MGARSALRLCLELSRRLLTRFSQRMAVDGVTWITGAGKLTPAAMVIPQRKGVGLSVLPQSKPPGRQGGGGNRRAETAAGKRGRHKRHTHDSSVSSLAELEKERGGAHCLDRRAGACVIWLWTGLPRPCGRPTESLIEDGAPQGRGECENPAEAPPLDSLQL